MVPRTDRIEEWKDIAGYLGRSIKTVQRWQKDLGLPVQRESLAGRVRVFAYASELDEWMARHVLTSAGEEAQTARATGSPWRRWISYLSAAVLLPLLAFLLLRVVGVRSGTAVVKTPVTSGRLLWRATAEGKTFDSATLQSPFDMAEMSADDRTLYCAVHLKSELRIVDTESLAVRTVMLPEPIKAMKMAPDGKTLFAATPAGDLLLLDPGTLRIKRRVAVGGPVNDIAVTPDSDTLFLAMMHRGVKKYVVSVDEVTQVTANICPYFLALSPQADQLAVSYQCGGPQGREGHDSVELFDIKTGKSLQVFTGPPLVGGGLEYSLTGERLWVDASDACFSATYDRIGCPHTPTFLYQVFELTPPRLLKSLVIPQYHGDRPLFLSDRAVLVRDKLMAVFDPVRFAMRERIDDKVPLSGVGPAALSRDRSRLFAMYGDGRNHRLWRVDIEPAQCAQPEVGIVHFLPFDGAPGDFIENAYVASRSELLFA
ncbi:MAG: hypothetical protein JNN08_10725, partial [Bryobacterales bacterium]|nr:hypothetical protein [Bryobacterales bacterium]